MIVKIKDIVKIFPGGNCSYYYVQTDSQTYLNVKEASKIYKARSFGSIPVQVTLRKTKWITSLFPTKDKKYILFIKKEVRKAENIIEGDEIVVKVEI